VGRTAGYSRGLATQRFGSKSGLTEAVIAYLHQKREALLEAARVAEMPALDALAFYMEGHLRDLRAHDGGKAYFMLLSAAVADKSGLRGAFAAEHERVRVWLRDQIERGQQAGEVRPQIDPDAGALMIGSLLLGVSIQWLTDPTTDLDPIAATIIAAFRQSFSTHPPL